MIILYEFLIFLVVLFIISTFVWKVWISKIPKIQQIFLKETAIEKKGELSETEKIASEILGHDLTKFKENKKQLKKFIEED